jgi:ATP synthase subunit 6
MYYSLTVDSPLDIFELVVYQPICILGYTFVFLPVLTNIIFFVILNIVFLIFLFWGLEKFNYLQKSRLSLIIHLFFNFIKNLLREILGGEQHIHFILFIVLGSLLFNFNFFGLLPFSLSVTSHFSITFSLSFIFFIGFNIIGLVKHGLNIVLIWLPTGTPYIVIPFIVMIEVISYTTRILSLSIRLFANIMSGHTLLKILSGFGWVIVIQSGFMLYFAFIPFVVIFIITGLECAIAALQAYVFLVLLTIYLNDTLTLHKS